MQHHATSSPAGPPGLPAPIKKQALAGPPALPVLGNLLDLNSKELHRVLERWIDQYGSLFKFKLGSRTVVVASSPDTVHYVLKNRPDLFRRLGKMDEIIREMGVFGVFNAEGAEWKWQRRAVSQALNVQHLKTFFPVLTGITGILHNRWTGLSAGGASVDVTAELMRYTVDVTSRLAFGYNMNTIEHEDVIQNHLETIFPAIFNRINLPFPYWRYIKLPADKKLERSLHVVYDMMLGVINQTRQQLEDEPELRKEPTNFLQALLADNDSGPPVSSPVIIGNVLTMLLAGEDTTAHSLAWIFYYMHLYPAVQRRMQEEADRVLGGQTNISQYEDAAKLTYIEAVAFEAMRLKPVSPFLFHEALADVVVESVQLHKGDGILLQTQHAPLQAAHFSNPHEFIPERWIDSGCPAMAAHNEKAFAPFGGGARFCPGYQLAMLEIKAVLAMACRNFQVVMETPPEQVKEILAFTMRPSQFLIKLTRRS